MYVCMYVCMYWGQVVSVKYQLPSRQVALGKYYRSFPVLTSLLIYFAGHVFHFLLHIKDDFKFRDCVRYNENFVLTGFCPILIWSHCYIGAPLHDIFKEAATSSI